MTDKDLFKTGGGLSGLKDVLDNDKDPLVGQTFGAYRISALLAEGGMGRVYRGVRADGQFDREVAIKVLPPGMGREYIKRFEQERQILASLSSRSSMTPAWQTRAVCSSSWNSSTACLSMSTHVRSP